MHRTASLRITASLFFTLLTALPFAQTARADSITISPPKFELFGNPGDTISEKIKVSNGDTDPLTLQSTVVDFTANGDEGGINLLEDPDAPITNISLARWVTVEPSRFTVPASSDEVISFTIKIPPGAEPGGKYASILISRAGEAVDGGASVTSTLGSLILLRVSGAVTEALSVDAFTTDDTYYQHGPVNFELRSHNTGNVHVAPTGTIVVTNLFGKKVEELPLTVANVLPDSYRIITTSWNGVPVGHYTATLVATYGESNQPFSATTNFTVLPVWIIITALGVILILFILISGRKKVRRLINRLTSD
jgi:hypothetical protein